MELWASGHGLSQRIKGTTRHRAVKAESGIRVESSLIDDLYSMEDENYSFTLDEGVSDHVILGYNLQVKCQNVTSKKLRRRDWRRFTGTNSQIFPGGRNVGVTTQSSRRIHCR